MKSDLDHVLFQSAYLLCLVDALIFGYSTFNAVPFAEELSIVLRICAAMFVFIKLILDQYYSIKMLLCLIVIGMILLVTYLNSGYSHIFYLLIICLGIRNIDSKTIISFDFLARIIICLLIILCGLTGVIENYVTYRTNSNVLRYSIGFNHPNTVASIMMSLVLEEAWINQRRASGFYTVVIWIIATIMYFITANRTAVLIMFVFPIVLFFTSIASDTRGCKRYGGVVLASLFPAAVVLSYMAMKLCRSSNLFRIIDYALSSRFYNASVVFDSYGVSLLGQRVALVSVKIARLTRSSIALLDVAYLRLLIQAGPIVLLLLSILYGSIMNRAWSERNNLLVLLLGIYILFGMCESGFNNVFMNYTLLLAAKELFHTDNENAEHLIHDQLF